MSDYKFIPRSSKRLELCGDRLRPLFEKIYEGAMIECIEGQCLDCMGFNREAITTCTDKLCPLHRWRPYQKQGAETDKDSGTPKETQ